MIFNNKNNNINENFANNVEVVSEKSEDNRSDITTTNYYIIQKCISQYLGIINKNNPAYYRVNDNGENVKFVNEDYIKGRIYDLLSENYINKNNITKNNVYSYVENITENVNFCMLDAKVIKNDNINQYIIYGFIESAENEFITNKYYIINLDENNNIFSVEPISKKYDNLNDISVDNVKIEKNENNKIPTVKINSETQCKNYLTEFKRMMLSNQEVAYEYLDKDYREKRFGNLNQFKNYINKNKDELKSLSVSEYLVNVYDDYTEFVCKDKSGIIYIFDAETPLKYTVKLDTYTIISDKYKSEYDSAETQKKVQMNIDKWVQMLNNRDYSSAYNLLDETFRNNTFGSQEKFEKYMNENYSLQYSITYNEYKEENDISIMSITLKDILGKNETTKDLKIIMQLNNNYDFVMSFEI
ncbi:MAG: hypothetical protein ACLUHC_06800 [Clostridia bacterium]